MAPIPEEGHLVSAWAHPAVVRSESASMANRSDQEAATVDHQSLAGHECLSHQVEIGLGNLLRVGDMPHR